MSLSQPSVPASRSDSAFHASGSIAGLVRDYDWAASPLGRVSAWPQSLKTTVEILLNSRYAMWMGWGPDLTFLYNDTYAYQTLAKKHPWALGRPAREVWSEIWHEIGPRIQKVVTEGVATWDEALPLFLERSGFREESYHTFSYSPLRDDLGGIAGMLCVVTEETNRVLSDRQLSSLRALAAALSGAYTEDELFVAAERVLETSSRDLPFTLTYLLDEDGRTAKRVSSTGFAAPHPAAPDQLSLADSATVWPVRQALAGSAPYRFELNHPDLPCGAWTEPALEALLVPIRTSHAANPAGFFIAGLNRYRIFTPEYAGYIELIAGQIGASLANARAYEQERKRAEALAQIDKAKTVFFSNVSHELRTPLTLMLGPLEDELARPSVAGEQRQSLELMHRNALRLLKLVNTLLEFSRVESGRVEARFLPTDLSTFTAQLASTFRSAIERAGIDFIIDCEPLPQLVYVDREMWEKIVLNLLSNALKSTFAGSIAVRLHSTATAIELQVADTGTGIPASEVPHLFERFRRVEGARLRTHEGSGIGLALVQELVRIHSGSIAVDTALDRGTTFTVAVPQGTAHLPSEHIAATMGSPLGSSNATAYTQEALSWLPDTIVDDEQVPSELPLDFHEAPAPDAPTVLLVDDNRDMREYVAGLLGRRFHIRTASNGRVALEYLLQTPPDLVLSDVMMPELDGFELLAAIRQHQELANVPVILLSARAGEESRIFGIEAGADDYLVKPFTARELLARVTSHLGMARLRAQAANRERQLLAETRNDRNRLQEREARLRAILQQVVSGICQIDRDGRFVFINDRFAEIAGRRCESLIGLELAQVLHPEDSLRAVELLQHILEDGRTFEVVQRFLRPDGTLVWVQSNYSAVLDEEGRPQSAVCVNQDITERKRTEDALRRSEKLAAVGQLASTIAHEINNPLESVTNLLYLIEQSSQMAEVQRYASLASDELQRVSHVVTSTLGFHRQAPQLIKTQLDELLDSAIFIYQGRLNAADIALERRYRGRLELPCYPAELRQVFANLIGNAFDASRSVGRKKIIVRARPACDWKTKAPGIRISIADAGHGMSRRVQRRIFEPFFTTKGVNGSGLGLWLSLDIVKKHHAKLQIKSREDSIRGGTVFSIFFPFDQPRSDGQPRTDGQPRPDGQLRPDGRD